MPALLRNNSPFLVIWGIYLPAKYFATAGDDGKIIIYDVKNQYRVVRILMTNEDKKRERLGWPTDKVKVIAINPSGAGLSAIHETSFNQGTLVLGNLNGLQN
jgi:hypothetical protein